MFLNLSFFSYLTGLLTFFFDSSSITLFGYYAFTTTLSWYLIQLSYTHRMLLLSFLGLLIGLLSFEQYGSFGLDLIYLIPVSLLTFALRNRLRSTRFLPIILLAVCLSFKIGILEHLYLHQPASMHFTIRNSIVNLLILIVMSLTVYPKGNLGNRL